MDYLNLIKSISLDKPVLLKSNKSIKYSTSNIGFLAGIKFYEDGKIKGIDVRFPGHSHNTWFWEDSEKTDSRSKYISELEIVNE